MCPLCNHLHEIDEKKYDSIKCEECGIEFSISDGINALNRNYKVNRDRGFKFYTKLKFNESNECYEECLKINPNDFDVLTRYILNLCYLNSLEETNFGKIIPLFEEREISLDGKNTYTFLAFIKDFTQNVSIYFREIYKRAIENNQFINEKYALSYAKSLYDLKKDFAYFKEVIPLLKVEEKNFYLEDQGNEDVLTRFEEYLNKVDDELKKTFSLINKGDFIINEDGLLNFLNENIIKGEEKEDKELMIIYPNREFQKKMRFFYILIGSLIAIGILFIILGLSLNNDILTYLAFLPAAILVVVFIIFYKEINK